MTFTFSRKVYSRMANLCLLVVKTDMSYQRPKFFVNVSNEKQVDKFSTTRDAGQLKLFITTVITFNLQSFFL